MNTQRDSDYFADAKSLGRVTELLTRHREGDQKAIEHLADVIYPLLLRLARTRRRRGATRPTLLTAEIANEVYLRFFRRDLPSTVQDRASLARALARATQNLVIDLFRRKHSLKRGHGVESHDLVGLDLAQEYDVVDHVALREALSRLRGRPNSGHRYFDVVTMRYYLGMTVEEIADLLQVAPRTVDYDWMYARAILARDLRPGSEVEPSDAQS